MPPSQEPTTTSPQKLLALHRCSPPQKQELPPIELRLQYMPQPQQPTSTSLQNGWSRCRTEVGQVIRGLDTIEDTMEGSGLSERGTWLKEFPNFMGKYSSIVLPDSYHPTDNPGGYINLGMAENSLCEDILTEKLCTPEVNTYEGFMQYYFEYRGMKSFRVALAKFLEERMESPKPIDHENLVVTSGAGAAIDLLSYMLCDPGDCCLVFAPYYASISADLGVRSRVTCVPVSLLPTGTGQDKAAFSVDIVETEKTIQKALHEGKRMQMALVINPHNPTGDILTKDQLLALLNLLNKYDMHVIMDEVYALSAFTGEKFTSVLSLESVPCPEKTHLVWGFSKDFSLSGFRCGVIHTLHKTLMPAATHLIYLAAVPPMIQSKLTKLINDKEWLDGVYFPENLRRLNEAFTYFKGRLEEMGARVHPSKGGFLMWADLSEFLPAVTAEEEIRLFKEIFETRMYCVPGTALFCDRPGWFRFSFAHPQDYTNPGLDRLEGVLKKRIGGTYVENGCGGPK